MWRVSQSSLLNHMLCFTKSQVQSLSDRNCCLAYDLRELFPVRREATQLDGSMVWKECLQKRCLLQCFCFCGIWETVWCSSLDAPSIVLHCNFGIDFLLRKEFASPLLTYYIIICEQKWLIGAVVRCCLWLPTVSLRLPIRDSRFEILFKFIYVMQLLGCDIFQLWGQQEIMLPLNLAAPYMQYRPVLCVPI